jgi:hypothetical protein
MNKQTKFSKNSISTASLQKTAYYIPPIPEWRPLKNGQNSTVRMACILDDYIFEGMRFEATLLPLTEGNWKRVLRYGKPDLLLINSFIESATGDWNMAQLESGKSLLLEVLSFAKDKQIPTVYWFTKDHKYHHLFSKLCCLFDWVFCADPEEVDMLSAEGLRSSLMLPCVQPALYNPFRHFDDYQAIDIELLVDGWTTIDRYAKEYDYLKLLFENCSLKIVESNYIITKNRVEASLEYKSATLGYISEKTKQALIKYVSIYLGLTPNIQDETERMWSYLEVAASRVCIIHMGGSILHSDFNDLVLHVENSKELETILKWFKIDSLIREKHAHIAWRETTLKHTFAHRLKQICIKIGVANNWNEYPKASLIFPTYRTENIERCIYTYNNQVYKNKEFVLVFNGNGSLPKKIRDKLESVQDAIVLSMPRNCFAGDCINYGLLSSTGKYIFRIDDDDYYSDQYILDRVLCHRAVDFDFLANPHTLFFYFVEDGGVYLRKTKSPPFAINPLGDTPVKFTGNTYSGKRELFQDSPFKTNNYSAADVFFLDNLPPTILTGSADYFNMAAERRVDQTTHTWRLESHDKLKSGNALFQHYECVSC